VIAKTCRWHPEARATTPCSRAGLPSVEGSRTRTSVRWSGRRATDEPPGLSLNGPLRATLPAAVLIGLSFHSLAHRYCRLMPDSLKQRPAGFFLPTKVCRCQRLCGVQKRSGQITGHFAGYSTALLLRVAYEYAWHRPTYCNFYPNVRKYARICHM
jgi:hypothetical protein